jgi:hypothetical protein
MNARLLPILFATVSLLLLPGCDLPVYAGAASDPESNLRNQQKIMDRQLGRTAYDRAGVPPWMGYR